MESLLSLSFDYLSSYDGIKIRKGLRQLEGLLAQICLSRSNTIQDRRHSIAVSKNDSRHTPKELGDLKDDPAFREYFKLQEGFEFNGWYRFYLAWPSRTVLLTSAFICSGYETNPHTRTPPLPLLHWRQ